MKKKILSKKIIGSSNSLRINKRKPVTFINGFFFLRQEQIENKC